LYTFCSLNQIRLRVTIVVVDTFFEGTIDSHHEDGEDENHEDFVNMVPHEE
jgi:hypothetical protein